MATRYWVGGSGTWNSLTTTNWSATSGGAGGASAPTSADDVIFNSASSASTYVVTCQGSGFVGNCKSITTTAPAVGTLTFNAINNDNFFNVFDGNVNIHAACLFTGFGTITHAPATAGTYTVTFNSSGGNTQTVRYNFTQASASTTLNFCNSNTATFLQLALSVGGALVCTGAVLSNSSANPYSLTFGSNATSVTMTGTTVNTTSSTLTIGGSSTTTWAISTLAVNLIGSQLLVGQNAATQPTAMGAVTFTNSFSAPSWFARATTLTLNSSGVSLLTGLTTTGAVSLTDSVLITTGTSSFGSTITGTTSIPAALYDTASQMYFEGTTTVTGAVSFTGQTNFPTSSGIIVNGTATFSSTLSIVNSGSIQGTGSLISGDITIANSASGASYISVANLTTTSLTAPVTSVDMSGALVVNGGVGKTFSLTNGFVLRFGSLNVSTPTCTITGAATIPVNVNQPISSTNPAFRPFTRTGAAPTLSYVNFFGTTINGGGTNYSGTNLGTDGLSSGFLPTTPKTVYLITTGTSPALFYSAIWTLAPSGGTGSTANIPLPQDTIIVNGNYGGSFPFELQPGGAEPFYVGSVFGVGNIFGSGLAFNTFYDVYLFGEAQVEANSIVSFGNLIVAKSGNTNRYLTFSGTQMGARSLSVDIGSASTLTISGTDTPSFGLSTVGSVDFKSGNIVIGSGVSIGRAASPSRYFNVYNGATVSGGGWVAHTNVPTYELGAVITSSNYVMNIYYSNAVSSRYTNSATTTALNGALVVRSNTSSPTLLGAGSTTAANPMRYIEFNSGVSSGANVLSLEGDAYVQDLYSSNTNSVTTTLQSFGGPWTIYKTNGGTAYLQKYTANTTVFNVLASPANTFYTNGTLVGTTTGWNSGAPPASPPSGGFIFF